jgi:microsomal epoxide hydrolase
MTQPSIGNGNARVIPFTVHISEDSLIQLDTLLSITPIAEPTYETSLPDGKRKFGMRRDWLTKAVEEWKTTFDWWVPIGSEPETFFSHYQGVNMKNISTLSTTST